MLRLGLFRTSSAVAVDKLAPAAPDYAEAPYFDGANFVVPIITPTHDEGSPTLTGLDAIRIYALTSDGEPFLDESGVPLGDAQLAQVSGTRAYDIPASPPGGVRMDWIDPVPGIMQERRCYTIGAADTVPG